MGGYGGDSAGPGGVERRRVGFEDDVYWLVNFHDRRFCVGFMDASFHKSKREKEKRTDMNPTQAAIKDCYPLLIEPVWRDTPSKFAKRMRISEAAVSELIEKVLSHPDLN